MTQQLSLAPGRALPWQAYLAGALRLGGWLFGTALAVVGTFILAVFVLGDGSLAGLFEQLAALSSHYASATAERRALFEHELAIATIPVTLLAVWFRRAGALNILNDLKEAHDGRG